MPNAIPKPARCMICGHLLTVHQRATGETCDAPDCKHERLRGRLQAEYERKERLRAEAEVRQQAGRGGSDCEREAAGAEPLLPIVLLPVNERRLSNLPEKRRRRFRDYLQQSISAAAAHRSSGQRGSSGQRDAADEPSEANQPKPTGWQPVTDPDLLGMLGQACGTCRGNCCDRGGEHAFLRPGEIARYMERHPRQRPRDVLAAYLERLGTVSFEGSCVYHGPEGCRLPREMRSSTCNDYLCEALMDIRILIEAHVSPALFAAAANQERVVHTRVLGEPGGGDRGATMTESHRPHPAEHVAGVEEEPRSGRTGE